MMDHNQEQSAGGHRVNESKAKVRTHSHVTHSHRLAHIILRGRDGEGYMTSTRGKEAPCILSLTLLILTYMLKLTSEYYSLNQTLPTL